MSEPEPTTEELIRLIRIHDNWDAGKELASRLESAREAMREAREMIAALCGYPGGEAALDRLRRELER